MNRIGVSCVEGAMRILFAVALLPAVASAAPYDKMFEVGTTMVYDSTQDVKWGDAPSKPVQSVRATCRVASVKTIAGAKVASIECDTEYSWIAGLYMSTKRGLWHLSEATASEVRRTLRYEQPLMPARPSKRVRNKTDKETGLGERMVIRKTNGRWCAENWSGDPNAEGTTTTCFADGLIVERVSDGMWYSEGGGESLMKSVLVSQPLPKPSVSPSPPLKNTSP
jgi:hypothetical protein